VHTCCVEDRNGRVIGSDQQADLGAAEQDRGGAIVDETFDGRPTNSRPSGWRR